MGGHKLAAALHLPTDKKMLRISQLQLSEGHAEWWFYLMGLAVWLYNFLFISINRFSLHPFCRDRLSRTFLIIPKDGKLASADELKMSELNGATSTAPYHIINTALTN